MLFGLVAGHATDVDRALQGIDGLAAIEDALRRRADQYREVELARAMGRLAKGDNPAAVLEALAKGLANKFLHHPSQALSRAGESEREQLLRAIETLYPEIEPTDPAPRP